MEELRKHYEQSTLQDLVENLTDRLERVTEQLQREVAERKLAEDALKESEEFYKSKLRHLEEEVRIRQKAIESSIGAIIMADLEGEVKVGNWSFLNLFGFDSEKEVLGKSIENFWVPRVPPYWIIDSVRSEGMWRGELAGRNKEGSEFIVDASISIILDPNDEPIGIAGFFNDITEKKETEIKMRETSKMVALGEFVAGAAHEINNPIGVISGNAQYLLNKFSLEALQKMGKKEFKKVRESLEMINKHSLRCGEITRKLLAFKRGGEETVMNPTSLNSILKEVLSMVEHQMELSGVTIDSQLRHLPRIKANTSQINQVFMNLMLNARQAMPKGGKLTVKTGLSDRNKVRVEVIDTGVGITEENLERVFEPFFTTRHAGGGTGLGLAVTYSIVKTHNGDVRIESKPGHGTKVIVELPI